MASSQLEGHFSSKTIQDDIKSTSIVPTVKAVSTIAIISVNSTSTATCTMNDSKASDDIEVSVMNTDGNNQIDHNHTENKIEVSASVVQHSINANAVSAVQESIEISRIYKILVVGNAKCGKSSIISKYAYKNIIDGKYKTTIGADFIRKDVSIYRPSDNNQIGVRLQLWDIAGQDRFQKLTRAYFNKARGVVIVCDISREGTIEAVKNWKIEIDAWSDQAECKDIPIVLFANKADLLSNAQDALKTGAIMERSE